MTARKLIGVVVVLVGVLIIASGSSVSHAS